MTERNEKGASLQFPPTRLSRIYPAPRETVFKAWSTTEHVQRWFTPQSLSTPYAKVEMQAGGLFIVCMRAADGVEHWTRGTFTEVSPPDRLVLDLYAEDAGGRRLFRAFTEVSFTDVPQGTRMDVVQSYTLFDPAAAHMINGAPIGWGQSLDHLAAEIAWMHNEPHAAARSRIDLTASRSVVHSVFHLERTYEVTAENLFKAFSDQTAKSKWFSGDKGQWELLERQMDFRVQGRERLRGRWESGVVSTFDAIYHDIIPNERILYTYEMHLDDKKISVSLATLQFNPAGSTRATLRVTEQGAFLDGYDDAGSRERGTAFLLDRLGMSLQM